MKGLNIDRKVQISAHDEGIFDQGEHHIVCFWLNQSIELIAIPLFLTTILSSPSEVYGAALTSRILDDLEGIHAVWLNGVLFRGDGKRIIRLSCEMIRRRPSTD